MKSSFTILAAAATFATFLPLASSTAQVISQWTFETNTPSDLANSSSGPSVTADVGNGTATGFHTSSNTDWSTPSGNGSPNAFSSNTWAVGDYYQFTLSTLGFSNIFVTFSQASSGTGPANFVLQYSTSGPSGSFSDFAPYTVSSTAFFDSAVYKPENQKVFDLSAISDLNENSSVSFRLVDTSTTVS